MPGSMTNKVLGDRRLNLFSCITYCTRESRYCLRDVGTVCPSCAVF